MKHCRIIGNESFASFVGIRLALISVASLVFGLNPAQAADGLAKRKRKRTRERERPGETGRDTGLEA